MLEISSAELHSNIDAIFMENSEQVITGETVLLGNFPMEVEEINTISADGREVQIHRERYTLVKHKTEEEKYELVDVKVSIPDRDLAFLFSSQIRDGQPTGYRPEKRVFIVFENEKIRCRPDRASLTKDWIVKLAAEIINLSPN